MKHIIGDDGDREWLCDHGVGHPTLPLKNNSEGIHTCDGCCTDESKSHVREPEPHLAEAGRWWHDDGVNGWVLCPDAPLLRDRFPHQYYATRPGASAAKPGPPLERHAFFVGYGQCTRGAPLCLGCMEDIRALEARADRAEAGKDWTGMKIIMREGWARDENDFDERGTLKPSAKRGTALGPPVFVEQDWLPIKWDDRDDPDFCKLAGVRAALRGKS